MLLMMEGFDHYHIASTSASKLTYKGWIGQAFGGNPGRFPYGPQSQSVEIIAFNPIHKALPQITTDLVLGFAFKVQYLHGIHLLTLHDQNLSNAVAVGLTSDGLLTVTDTESTFIGTHPLLPNTWYYVELKLDSGTAELHLNGQFVEIGPEAGNFSNDWYLVTLANLGLFTPHVYIDDFYLCDLSGPVNNDFLGDVLVETLYPINDGTYTDWTPDTGTDHFSRVNEHQIDELASYVSTAGAGDKDSYGIGDPGIDNDTPVLGIQLNLGMEKLDAGVRTIDPLIRQAGVDYEGPTKYVSTDWSFVSWLLDEDPSGSPWTAANVMADEYGIEVVT